MKNSLWVVVVVVVGIVGFLLGYSFSSYTGVKAINQVQAAEGEAKEVAHQPAAAGYGAPAAEQGGGSPGYGAPAAPPPQRKPPAKPATMGY